MEYSKSFDLLLNLIQDCSNHLDKKFGFVISGSPTYVEIINGHYARRPTDSHVIYGMSLLNAFEKLHQCKKKLVENK